MGFARQLKTHAQAYQAQVVRTAWLFNCIKCGARRYLGGAFVEPNGDLVCVTCHVRADMTAGGFGRRPRLRWCPKCKLAKDWTQFRRETKHGPENDIHCADCRSVQRVPPVKVCEGCGAEFKPKRSDARYCPGSSRCRVAAMRARQRDERPA